MTDNANHQETRRKQVRKPTLKQRRFVEEYLNNGGNATKAALAVYNVKSEDAMNTAGSIGVENLQKPAVLALLNKNEEVAEQVIVEVMTNKHELGQTRVAAAKTLLAYTRGNPVSRNENVNVNVSLEDILASLL